MTVLYLKKRKREKKKKRNSAKETPLDEQFANLTIVASG